MVDVLPPVGAYPKWEVNGTATEGYITISVMQNGSIFVKQEMKTGAKTLLKTLQAINNAVTIKEEPMDEDDPVSANPSSTQSTPATVTSDNDCKETPDIECGEQTKISCSTDEPISSTKWCFIRIRLENVFFQSKKIRKDASKFPVDERGGSESSDENENPLDNESGIQSNKNQSLTIHKEQCKKCKREFKSNYLLKRHKCNLDESFIDPSVNAPDLLSQSESKAGDIKEQTTALSVAVDRKTRNLVSEESVSNDQNHVRSMHRQDKETLTQGLKEQCHVCGKLFANKFLVKRHNEQIHAVKTHTCEVCKKSYGSEKMLHIHARTSHGATNFLCSLCGKKLKSKFSLEQHVARHTATKSVICNVCGKMFKFTTDLDLHMKRMHGDNLPVRCVLCEKTFRTKRSLDEHNIKVHNFKAPLKCSVCGRGFVIKCKLDRHMNVHSGDRPFQCGECGKTFAQKNYLSLHLATHALEATYACNLCNKRFKTSKYLYNHMETHNTTKPKKHQCTQCSMNFRNNQLLKRHFAIHLNERRYKCEQCGKGFNSSGSLHHHRKTHVNDDFVPLVSAATF